MGDLIVNGDLTNTGGHALTVHGDLILSGALHFTPSSTGSSQGNLVVYGDMVISDVSDFQVNPGQSPEMNVGGDLSFRNFASNSTLLNGTGITGTGAQGLALKVFGTITQIDRNDGFSTGGAIDVSGADNGSGAGGNAGSIIVGGDFTWMTATLARDRPAAATAGISAAAPSSPRTSSSTTSISRAGPEGPGTAVTEVASPRSRAATAAGARPLAEPSRSRTGTASPTAPSPATVDQEPRLPVLCGGISLVDCTVQDTVSMLDGATGTAPSTTKILAVGGAVTLNTVTIQNRADVVIQGASGNWPGTMLTIASMTDKKTLKDASGETVDITPFLAHTIFKAFKTGTYDTKWHFLSQVGTYQREAITTGGSTTINDGVDSYAMHSAITVVTYTLTMPANPRKGQRLAITADAAISTLTVNPNSGQSIVGTITGLTLGQSYEFMWVSEDSTWYPV